LLVVLDVAGCGTVVLTRYNVAPQYRNLPHPTLPANILKYAVTRGLFS